MKSGLEKQFPSNRFANRLAIRIRNLGQHRQALFRNFNIHTALNPHLGSEGV